MELTDAKMSMGQINNIASLRRKKGTLDFKE